MLHPRQHRPVLRYWVFLIIVRKVTGSGQTRNGLQLEVKLLPKCRREYQRIRLAPIRQTRNPLRQRQFPRDFHQIAAPMMAIKAIPIQKYQVLPMVSGFYTLSLTRLTSPESVFSGWTGRSSAVTEASWRSNFIGKGEMVQPLSQNSYVTQSTEVTVSPRGSVNEDENIATTVRISSAGTIPIRINDSPSHL